MLGSPRTHHWRLRTTLVATTATVLAALATGTASAT